VAPVASAPASVPLALAPASPGAVPVPARTAAAAGASISLVARTLAAHDRLQLRITCPPQAAGTCSGSVTLATAKAVALKAGAKRKVVVLGRAAFHVRPGQRLLTRITLTPSGGKLVRRLGSVAVRLTPTAPGQIVVGAASLASQTFTLHRRS
jgi:hypothetical protein